METVFQTDALVQERMMNFNIIASLL